MGGGGGLALPEQPGSQCPFPASRPGQPLSTQLGGGRREGSARACILPSTLARHRRSGPRRRGWGGDGVGRPGTLLTPPRWPRPGGAQPGQKQVAGPSGRARATGRVGEGERSWQAGGPVVGLGPGSNAGVSSLEAGPRPFHCSTRRLYQAARPPLPCGRTSAWAPSSQRERCGGDKGNGVAKTRADRGQPGTGDNGAQIPGAPAQRASSGPCDQSLPREVGGPGAGNLGLEASMSNPSSSPTGRACQHPACPSLPDSSPVLAALGP